MASILPGFIQVWQRCQTFVQSTCSNRDNSAHGPKHAQEVSLLTHKILVSDEYVHKSWIFHKCAIAVALIHDVLDPKYPDPDKKLEEQLRTFLHELNLLGAENKNVADELIRIANHVSYRKENDAIVAGKPLNFAQILNTPNLPDAHEIRNIVSDADKLSALGARGFERLICYTIWLFRQENNGREPTHAELSAIVNSHSKEKLLRLKDKFIRTRYGKFLANEAHQMFVQELDTFNFKEKTKEPLKLTPFPQGPLIQ